MSRYRLRPTPDQQAMLRGHRAHARYVWNLAVEQHSHWRPGRAGAPDYPEQCRQLTQARAENPWLAHGSHTVQQQALRDFARAMAAFFDQRNPAGRPSWRKSGRDEGFRIVGRRGSQWDVRWSRPVPPGVKSYRVTMDRAGRCHVAFAAIPDPIPAPGNGDVVGIDRGVAVGAALSTGELLRVADLTDRRKDWAEKTSTYIARRFDVIRIEDLKVSKMTRSAKGTAANPGRNVRAKAGLNRKILRSGWGLLARRLEEKAPGRVDKISPAFTSQRCSACGHVDAKSRESQARFACTACGFADHADVNAARNIVAGHAVTARGGDGVTGPVNREPQLLLQSA
jgi:putative transposase